MIWHRLVPRWRNCSVMFLSRLARYGDGVARSSASARTASATAASASAAFDVELLVREAGRLGDVGEHVVERRLAHDVVDAVVRVRVDARRQRQQLGVGAARHSQAQRDCRQRHVDDAMPLAPPPAVATRTAPAQCAHRP
jgi:hypothetical protein